MSPDPSVEMFVAGICSFIPYLFSIPISVYGTVRLYQYKNELFVQKRNLSISFGLNCAFIFQMMTSCCAHLSILYLNTISITISFSVFFLAYWILVFFLNTKNWIIYYHEKWTYYVKDMEWQQIINHKVKESGSKRNWFITNRHKYGNRLYIFKLFGVLHLFGLALLISAQCVLITSDGHPDAITFSIIMITVTIIPYILFYVFLVFKTPRFNDIFYIHWESTMHARLIIIIGIGLIAFNLWFAIDFTANISKIWAMLCFPFVTLMLFMMNMISTLFIINKTRTSLTKRNNNKHTTMADKKPYNLDRILETKETFHLFMSHLSKEFSMECLLAYIELTQFQEYIIQNNTDNNKVENTTIEKLKLIIFPSSIPLSHIVEDNIHLFKFKNIKNNDMQYKLKLAKLFEKYVKVGSEFEINISYRQRMEWMGMMSTPSNLWSFMHVKVNLNEILLLIEDCKTTMNKLLQHSLNRFKSYAKFAEVQQILDRKASLANRRSNTSLRRYRQSDASETGQSRISVIMNRFPSLKPRHSLSRSKSLEPKPIHPDIPKSIHENESPDILPGVTPLQSVPTVSAQSFDLHNNDGFVIVDQ